MNLSSAKYRITYEAFSKLSGSLSKVESVEELGIVANRHLKYLFNFKMLRIVMLFKNETAVSFTFLKSKEPKIVDSDELLDYEKQLFKVKIPLLRALNTTDLPGHATALYENWNKPKLWGWHTTSGEREICFSLISDDTESFNHSDMEILNLLVDNITSRYFQIYLSQQLKTKNLRLKEAITEIELKNTEIERINNNQQNIIFRRTEELHFKNKKLLELSKLNAHDLREPLTRILGFLEISELYTDEDLRKSILPKLKESALELDLIFRRVVSQSEQTASNANLIENGYD
ncbi:hypothetical protein [Leeuwenhoekiella parthenopeia]|uniref:Signal transduction histidine kinase dimerisation/phosphoacceptor domain-containing protein n=1 Tax=Leeuwenhoekiella parthenopeia TaxID=2890320 RepID=A0ABS8GQE5_9FLAO|nr:hypothetical protein [Leeuwenhoekiella parthenopeia]MCC4211915.1 hypothetical protein [Leeuwenhoekiella parthenopeia]